MALAKVWVLVVPTPLVVLDGAVVDVLLAAKTLLLP